MSDDTSRKLQAHREALKRNERAYVQDLDLAAGATTHRVATTAVTHLRRCGFGRVTATRCGPLVMRFVQCIFEAQDRKPFFHVEGTLPYCWNRVKHWDKNYIRYEWGHLHSRNEDADDVYQIQNLCLQSARCNQHIQTSMNIEDVMEWLKGSAVAVRARTVLDRRATLFASIQWRDLLHELETYRTERTGRGAEP